MACCTSHAYQGIIAEDGVELFTEVLDYLDAKKVCSWYTDVNEGVTYVLQRITRGRLER